jgi:hypothetical protein
MTAQASFRESDPYPPWRTSKLLKGTSKPRFVNEMAGVNQSTSSHLADALQDQLVRRQAAGGWVCLKVRDHTLDDLAERNALPSAVGRDEIVEPVYRRSDEHAAV